MFIFYSYILGKQIKLMEVAPNRRMTLHLGCAYMKHTSDTWSDPLWRWCNELSQQVVQTLVTPLPRSTDQIGSPLHPIPFPYRKSNHHINSLWTAQGPHHGKKKSSICHIHIQHLRMQTNLECKPAGPQQVTTYDWQNAILLYSLELPVFPLHWQRSVWRRILLFSPF